MFFSAFGRDAYEFCGKDEILGLPVSTSAVKAVNFLKP